jgi:hypothetical protein
VDRVSVVPRAALIVARALPRAPGRERATRPYYGGGLWGSLEKTNSGRAHVLYKATGIIFSSAEGLCAGVPACARRQSARAPAGRVGEVTPDALVNCVGARVYGLCMPTPGETWPLVLQAICSEIILGDRGRGPPLPQARLTEITWHAPCTTRSPAERLLHADLPALTSRATLDSPALHV